MSEFYNCFGGMRKNSSMDEIMDMPWQHSSSGMIYFLNDLDQLYTMGTIFWFLGCKKKGYPMFDGEVDGVGRPYKSLGIKLQVVPVAAMPIAITSML